MLEDASTVEKSVNKMIELTGKMDIQSQNQMVRWVMNKEDHAQKIIDTISDYYLTQRVKPSQKDYAERLKYHHAVILAAMKAKQNPDLKSVKALKKSISTLTAYYPEHKH
jgi:nickel superoxide dismutase